MVCAISSTRRTSGKPADATTFIFDDEIASCLISAALISTRTGYVEIVLTRKRRLR